MQKNISPYIYPGLRCAVPNPLTVKFITTVVTEKTGIALHEMQQGRRLKEIVTAKHLLWYMWYKYLPKVSYSEIAQKMGFNTDHTTIMNGVKKIDNWCKTDPDLLLMVQQIKRSLLV